MNQDKLDFRPWMIHEEEILKYEVPYTDLQLVNRYGTYLIRLDNSDMTVEDMFLELFIPILQAAGYALESIEDYMDTYVREE